MLVKVPFFNIVNHHMKLTINAGNLTLGITDHIRLSVAWMEVITSTTMFSCTHFPCRVQCMAMRSDPSSNACFERPIVDEGFEHVIGVNLD